VSGGDQVEAKRGTRGIQSGDQKEVKSSGDGGVVDGHFEEMVVRVSLSKEF